MNNQRRNFRLTCALLAAVLAVGVAGCAQPAEDKQPQGKTQQLWIADNFVDPQEGYPMENPSAIELSATAALQKNSLLNGQTQKQQQTQEMKAVWLSYLDLKPMLLDKNDKSVGKAQFTKNIQKAFDNIQQLGLYDTRLAILLPGAVSTFNLIIMRTAMASIDISLEESARLDGANHFTILSRIMVPLTKPTMAVLVLYYGVGHWNSWFSAMN